MNVFKLFYIPNKTPKFDAKYFYGNSKNVLGVEINPENYSEFMNKHSKTFIRSNAQQNIMTNYKFLKFIEQRNKLGVEILNIQLVEKEQLIYSQNESYCDLLNSLNRVNIYEAIECLNELIDDGFNISTVECILKDKNQHRLNVHNNGTISCVGKFEDIKEYIKNNHILDYLCMGIVN